MAYISGVGGYVDFGSGSGSRVEVSKWTLNKTARLTENSHSGVSATNYDKVIPDNSGTIELPLDESGDINGVSEGDKVTLRLHIGSGAHYYTVTNTTIENIVPVNDVSGDIVRASVAFKGGAVALT